MWKFIKFLLLIACFFSLCTKASAIHERPSGRIAFLGKTSNNQFSVWLSKTGAGLFEIEAANQIVDEWSQPDPGLHVTLSPVVSTGNDAAHSLFQIIDGEMVFIDRDTQQGGITFPPLPGGLPPSELSNPMVHSGETTHSMVSATREVDRPSSSRTPPSASKPIKSTTADNASSETTLLTPKRSAFTNTVPITPGRQFKKQHLFNVWADGRLFDVKDTRYGLDRRGSAKNLTMGGDIRINSDFVFGGMMVANKDRSSNFNRNWLAHAKGFSAGPYFGYRISRRWAIDGNLGFGIVENQNKIVFLKSKYHTKVYSASMVARGFYKLGQFQLQPKPAIYYNYFRSSHYNLNGTTRGFFCSIPINAYHFSFGYAQFSTEISRPINFENCNVTLSPYVDLGINYAYARPNKGRILTGNLTLQSVTPWSGLARIGIKALMTPTFFIEATSSYLSFGQPHLNIWLTRLFLSLAFD